MRSGRIGSYIISEAAKGLGRNLTMTVALIITTAISVALLAAGVLVNIMTGDTKAIYLERVEVMVQLTPTLSNEDHDCSSQECKSLKNILEQDTNVERVTYRNREDSYERFREVFAETDPLLVQETSPDALPAALHVRLADPTNTAIIDSISDHPGVDVIVDQADEVRSATSHLDAIRNATFLLALAQAVAAVLLIANMVQLAAYSRSTQLSIMRIVGASRWFTQAPFIMEAMAAVFIGVVLAAVTVIAGKNWVVDPALDSLYSSQLLAPIQMSELWIILPLLGIAAMISAALAAWVSLRAYVRT